MRKQTTGTDIMRTNKKNVFRLMREGGGYTRQEIVGHTGLSLPTVTQKLNELVGEGLVAEVGTIGNTGGRRAITYGLVPCAHTALGLDITRNHNSAVAVDLRGIVISHIRVRRKFSATEEYTRQLGALVESFIDQSDLDRNSILGVGIGVPGLVTKDNQQVFYGEILGFTGTTCEEIARYIPYPSSLHNDANAAGYAEIWARKEIRNAFYVMLSNNIGGSVVINGSIYSGEQLRSGEVGHMRMVENGKPCYCGQRGCVDAYLAATVLSGYTGGNLGDFFELLEERDTTAVTMWDEYLSGLAFVVNNLQMLFDCPIILGGYVGEYLEPYLPELKIRAAALHSFVHNADYLQVCQYKTQAIAAGAALNYISEFIRSV